MGESSQEEIPIISRSIQNVGTRASIQVVTMAVAIYATATAGVAPESARGPPPPPQPAKIVTSGYKVTEIATGHARASMAARSKTCR